MSEFTLFECAPWERYLRQLEAESYRQYQEWETEQDLEREHELRGEFFDELEADEVSEDDWPWYADDPYEVQHPQVFDP